MTDIDDMDPGSRSRVNESPHPARLGRGLHRETHQAHSGADHPQDQNLLAADIAQGKAIADVSRVIDVA